MIKRIIICIFNIPLNVKLVTTIMLLPIVFFIVLIRYKNYKTSYVYLFLLVFFAIKIVYPFIHILTKGIFAKNFKEYFHRELNELIFEIKALFFELGMVIFFAIVLLEIGLIDKATDFLHDLTNTVKTILQNKL